MESGCWKGASKLLDTFPLTCWFRGNGRLALDDKATPTEASAAPVVDDVVLVVTDVRGVVGCGVPVATDGR